MWNTWGWSWINKYLPLRNCIFRSQSISQTHKNDIERINCFDQTSGNVYIHTYIYIINSVRWQKKRYIENMPSAQIDCLNKIRRSLLKTKKQEKKKGGILEMIKELRYKLVAPTMFFFLIFYCLLSSISSFEFTFLPPQQTYP